jgi:hypothetical protein
MNDHTTTPLSFNNFTDPAATLESLWNDFRDAELIVERYVAAVHLNHALELWIKEYGDAAVSGLEKREALSAAFRSSVEKGAKDNEAQS